MTVAQLELDFIAVFTADPAFAGWQLAPAQSAAELDTPAAAFSVTEEDHFNASGKAGRFALAIVVRTSSSEPKGAASSIDQLHQSRVTAVRTRLTGTGKAALLTALNATARWNCPGYSAAPTAEDETGLRFETTVRITGTIV